MNNRSIQFFNKLEKFYGDFKILFGADYITPDSKKELLQYMYNVNLQDIEPVTAFEIHIHNLIKKDIENRLKEM